MKIIFVVPDMAGGGTEKVISLLANHFVSSGIETSILSFAGSQQAYPLDERVETVSAGAPSGGSLKTRWNRLKYMRRYFKKNRGAYIFSFSTIGTGFIVLSTLGMKRKMLVSERTDPDSCDHKPYRNFFYRFADCLVCQTEDAVKCFPEYLQKKAVVIANPIESQLPEFDGERKKKIVTAGRLQPVKNHEMLIRAFGQMVKKHPDYSLHIYGQGDMELELKELTQKLQLEKQVTFHGFCRNAKEEMKDASMFVLSSNYEGISNSMIEALAMGIPVIATDCPIGGCRTYIQNEENGLLVPVGDEAKLAEAMCRIAEDFRLAEKFSVNGKKIKTECSVQNIADLMLKAAGCR